MRWFLIAACACAAAIALVTLMIPARAAAPKGQYSYTASSMVVYDNRTNLTWQRGISNQMPTWSDAVDYCRKMSLEGRSWRLPHLRELATLVDTQASEPAIDRAAFPNTPGEGFWSMTRESENPEGAWTVHFLDGSSVRDLVTNPGSLPYRARCVTP